MVPSEISVHAADDLEPIRLAVELRAVDVGSRRFAVPVYTAHGVTRYGDAPPVLCLAGGGSSGVLFAKVLQRAAARGVRAVAFDHPGHTPHRLLGARTPPRDLLRFATPHLRRCIVARLLDDLLGPDEEARVRVLSHSAGLLDAADLDLAARRRVAHFALLAAGVPGFAGMLGAQRAARARGLASSARPAEILRTRALPTGHPAFHFGADEQRAVGDETLARYQGHEHWAVVARLLFPRSLSPARWAGARVDLMASEGDLIAPPHVMRELADWLSARGAKTELHVIEAPLPHMFMMFEEGAERVAELLARTL